MAKSITESSIDDLNGKKKVLIGLMSVIGGLAIVYVATLLYFGYAGRWDQTKTISIVPLIGLIVSALPSIINLKAINAEIARRESQDS